MGGVGMVEYKIISGTSELKFHVPEGSHDVTIVYFSVFNRMTQETDLISFNCARSDIACLVTSLRDNKHAEIITESGAFSLSEKGSGYHITLTDFKRHTSAELCDVNLDIDSLLHCAENG
jgi:hypothetical protein